MKHHLTLKLLKEEIALLQNAVDTLMLSVEKCRKIGRKDDYSFEEMESFDSLTSKFKRASDIYTQKVLRSVWALLHEPFAPFIDLMNKAEKLSLIGDAETMITIRDIRNQIAHEYLPQAIAELVPEMLKYSRLLADNIALTIEYVHMREWA